MTYKNKTITKHQRGNWYVRVRRNGKVITIYGHTQIECYNKLKIIADKIEIEKSQKVLEKLTAINIVATPTAKRQSTYTLKEWFDEWLQSYKVGNVRQVTITGFTKDIKHLQGMRKGEMLALRPNDFDFDQNTLRIDESYDHNNPDDLMTKNQASNRTMPMFDLTRQLLLKYKDYEPTKRIYENFNGITLGLWLAKLLKANDLPRLTLHELRHTFITRCHEKNIDELIIQKWVGHAKGSRMTKAVYTHINNDTELKSIELLNEKIA